VRGPIITVEPAAAVLHVPLGRLPRACPAVVRRGALSPPDVLR